MFCVRLCESGRAHVNAGNRGRSRWLGGRVCMKVRERGLRGGSWKGSCDGFAGVSPMTERDA
eukprot:4806754-Alexandrium_andersonii.AAC.1